jgi:hypothetical protein
MWSVELAWIIPYSFMCERSVECWLSLVFCVIVFIRWILAKCHTDNTFCNWISSHISSVLLIILDICTIDVLLSSKPWICFDIDCSYFRSCNFCSVMFNFSNGCLLVFFILKLSVAHFSLIIRRFRLLFLISYLSLS